MMKLSRRDFLSISTRASALVFLPWLKFAAPASAAAQALPGVAVAEGTDADSAEQILQYCLDCGISAVELMSNAAESYALAIAHLADRLRGGGPWLTAWPTLDPGLSRAERRELQTLLDCKVDVMTKAGLRPRIRPQVLKEARPL